MKLDIDLVREILRQAEAAPPNESPTLDLPEHAEAAVIEHIELLNERGLIEARMIRSGMGGGRILAASVERLTWEGHEFLGNAKNEEVWTKTKKFIASKGGSLSFEVLKAVLVQAAKTHFLLPA